MQRIPLDDSVCVCTQCTSVVRSPNRAFLAHVCVYVCVECLVCHWCTRHSALIYMNIYFIYVAEDDASKSEAPRSAHIYWNSTQTHTHNNGTVALTVAHNDYARDHRKPISPKRMCVCGLWFELLLYCYYSSIAYGGKVVQLVSESKSIYTHLECVDIKTTYIYGFRGFGFGGLAVHSTHICEDCRNWKYSALLRVINLPQSI